MNIEVKNCDFQYVNSWIFDPTCFLFLFPDPRKWSRDEVRQWLIWMSARHSLPLDPDRFQMNGKALCLMSLAMFAVRVPLGGKLLYKDFQLRLTSAFHIENQRFINTRIK